VGTKLYITNIPLSVGEAVLAGLFSRHGRVAWARLARDAITGRSRGFGIVEMSTPEEAQAATAALDRHVLDGRCLTVSQAEPVLGRPAYLPSRARK
jgi:RNA recognition motif-containing protein